MNKHVNVTVTLELPSDIFEAATALLSVKSAFDELRHALDAKSVVAAVVWNDQVAASASPKRRPTLRWKTPERIALAERLYTTDIPVGDIVARVNCLPGARNATKNDVYAHCVSVAGLARPVTTPEQRRMLELRERMASAAAN